METRTLIPAHTGFGRRQNKLIKFCNTSNLRDSSVMPPLHSIVSNTNGSMTLTEYANQAEFTEHRNKVFAAISRFHATHGKQTGCGCDTCKGGC